MKDVPATSSILLVACGLTLAAAGKTTPATGIAGLVTEHVGQLSAEAHADLSSPQMGAVAGVLTDLLRTDKDSNNSAVVSEMYETLETMKVRLRKAHNKSIDAIDAARGEFATCTATYQVQDAVRFPGGVGLLQKTHVSNTSGGWWDDYFEAYVNCKTWEQELSTNLTTCEYYCLQQSNGMKEVCVTNDLSAQCSSIECEPQSGEEYLAYLDRMISELQAEIAKVNSSKACTGAWLNDTYSHDHRCETCENIPDTVEECYKKCHNIIEPIDPDEDVIPGCCVPLEQVELETCTSLYSQSEAWANYSQCYDSALTNWNTVKAEHEAEADVRMAQMRAVLRIDCYFDSFEGDQTSKINACIETSFVNHAEVLSLDIDAGDAPAKLDEFTCNASDTPGSPEYEAAHYGHLPAGLITCPNVHCEDACGFTNVSRDYYASTTTSPDVEILPATGRCYKQTDPSSGVYWDFGSAQNVGDVSARPAGGVSGVEVYLTSIAPGTAPDELTKCGEITTAQTTISCDGKTAARYLVMKAKVDGQCIFGSCAYAWCEMMLDGADLAAEQGPMAGTGTEFQGAIAA